MSHLIPTLMGKEQASLPGLCEALHAQLLENGVKILNEGASRGLPERFCKALEMSSISMGRVERVVYWKGWRSELYMVGGLLKWIATGRRDAYFTKSALVARTALYMKEVGYTLGAIHTWNGVGKRPTTPRGVILVIGGASSVDHNALSTDEYVSDDQGPLQFPKPIFISHYRFATFGAVLIDTLQANPKDPADCAEVFQENLYRIHASLSEKLRFTWTTSSEDSEAPESGKQAWALPVWKKSNSPPSPNHPNALRLSSVYFAEVAALLAPYYESIASPDVVRIASTQQDRDDRTLGFTSALVKFRTITASIILSVVTNIAGKDFESLHHASSLSLHTPKIMRNTCTEVAKLLKGGLSFPRVATLIAYLHCGTNAPLAPDVMQDEEAHYSDADIVGWRNGRHAVLPSLLFTMSAGPSPSALGFRCTDNFIGNIPVYPDGSIKSNKHSRLIGSFENLEPLHNLSKQSQGADTGEQLAQINHKVSLGQPIKSSPDVALHLTLERPLDRAYPDLSLCGRVNGDPIGTVGLLALLQNLIQSGCAEITNESLMGDPEPCTRMHSQTIQLFNVSPSVWAQSVRKPTGGTEYHTYIPVLNDAAWSLFLLGESEVRVVLRGCAICIAEDWQIDDEKLIIVGFK
jgi:hypothetical protein